MKSLNQISMKLHITKSSLITRMDKINNFRNKYCIRKKNKLFINDKGIKLISYQKHNSTAKSFRTKHGRNRNQLTKSDLIKTIHQLLDLNSNLKSENKKLKDKRVASGIKESQRALPNKDLLNQVEANKNTIDILKLKLDSYKHMSFLKKLKLLFKQ